MFHLLLATTAPPHAPGFYIALAMLGCGIGILTGLFGAGGGFILTPGLNIFFGIPFPNAVGISLAQIFVTCASSAFKHWRRKNVDIKLSIIMALAASGGSLVGKQLMNLLEQHTGTVTLAGHDFSTLGLVMKALFLVMLFAVMLSILRETGRSAKAQREREAAGDDSGDDHHAEVSTRISQRLHKLRIPPVMSFPRSDITALTFWAPLGVSVAVGVMTGLMGVGGGFVLFPLLVYVLGVPTTVAVGTSAFQIVFATGIGTYVYWQDGKIWWPVVGTLLVGSLIGVQIGVYLAGKFGGLKIRRYFAYVIGLGIGIIVFSLVREFC